MKWTLWTWRKKLGLTILIAVSLWLLAVGFHIVSLPTIGYLNMTDSAPKGFYVKASDQTLQKDVFVLVEPRHRLDPFLPETMTKKPYLLKKIKGLPHETVMIHDESIVVNDESFPLQTHSTKGVPLTPFSTMDVVIGDNEYFLCNEHERSFDSRYFGPVPRQDIITVVTPIWIFGEGMINFVSNYQKINEKHAL